MKLKHYIIVFFALGLTSCELITPEAIINPNVDENTFLESYKSMKTWRNGAERDLATTVGKFVELTEIVSDNYFNNRTQSSKVFDFPKIDYQDIDVTNLQRMVARLRETAIYGIEKIEGVDTETSNEDRFTMRYIKGYSFLLAGENFTGLPLSEKGEVKSWRANLAEAVSTFKTALAYAENDDQKAFVNLLIARACYRLGERENAVNFANLALKQAPFGVKNVRFDGDNGVTNILQTYTYGLDFQPLPRLDFLDPKYFQLKSTEQRSIAIAKAEEAHLIVAEAQIAQGDLAGAGVTLTNLLTLVGTRQRAQVNDQTETRGVGGFVLYPNSSEYSVAASPTEEFRSGLVVDRTAPALVNIAYLSGTSVIAATINQKIATNNADEALKLLYLMRQEIFFAEGRRMNDLGIRMPVCFREASVNPSAKAYTQAIIPSFIPLNQEMDAFEMDKTTKTVVIKHNMNRVIVENKTNENVVPFI